MNLKKLSLGLILSLMTLMTQFSYADEAENREKIENEVKELSINGKFAELEQMATAFRDPQARTSSGLWKLTLFYVGLSKSFRHNTNDDEAWSGIEGRIKKWQRAYPNSAAAQLAYTEMLLNRAWTVRGSGFAGEVEEKNWKPFYAYVEKARVYLEAHKKIASKDPYWYQQMEGIAKYQSWPENKMEAVIDEGLSKMPQFYPLYFDAIDYYAPKWGGNAHAIEKFARKALERTEAVEGYGMYARIYWYAAQTQYRNRLFTESQVDWTTMKKGIDDVLKKYPDAWNINHFAKFACDAKDKGKTAELIGMIKSDVLPGVWGSQFAFEHCRRWSAIP
ncbi:DUF4034 domain-containing protein [Undibacterium sp. Tian12W]|uniref:DUF4034 domain-containing protein n=1 Tax=Undibacterium sp. Tian12W TaxID=3413054 RepID=UPI003BF09CD2